MADLTNITIPAAYNDVIAKILDTGYFSDQITICKFAFAYAIKNHFGEFNPSDIDKQNSGGDGGLNYNVGSFDGGDKFLFNFVSFLLCLPKLLLKTIQSCITLLMAHSSTNET